MAHFTLYIAGPVPGRFSPADIYESRIVSMYMRLDRVLDDSTILLPTKEFDNLDYTEYFQRISRRIQESDFVAGILGGRSYGPPMELVIASYFEKPFAVLAPEVSGIPYLLNGLPGLQGVFLFEQLEELISYIRHWKNSNLGGPDLLTH